MLTPCLLPLETLPATIWEAMPRDELIPKEQHARLDVQTNAQGFVTSAKTLEKTLLEWLIEEQYLGDDAHMLTCRLEWMRDYEAGKVKTSKLGEGSGSGFDKETYYSYLVRTAPHQLTVVMSTAKANCSMECRRQALEHIGMLQESFEHINKLLEKLR